MLDWRNSLQSRSMRYVVLGMCVLNGIGIYQAHQRLNEEVAIGPVAAPMPPLVARHQAEDFLPARGLPPVQPVVLDAPSAEPALADLAVVEKLPAAATPSMAIEGGAAFQARPEVPAVRLAAGGAALDGVRLSRGFAMEFSDPPMPVIAMPAPDGPDQLWMTGEDIAGLAATDHSQPMIGFDHALTGYDGVAADTMPLAADGAMGASIESGEQAMELPAISPEPSPQVETSAGPRPA